MSVVFRATLQPFFWDYLPSVTYGLDADGLMRLRIASINDLPIAASDRKFHWPLGRRPDDHPSLSDLGL